MKQRILLLLLCFLLTGCSVKYDLEVTENNIIENIDLQVDSSKLNTQMYDELTSDKNSVYLGEKKYYTVTKESLGTNLNLHYNYEHQIENFEKSKVINWCYHDKNIKKTEDKIIISTKGSFDCANKESKSRVENAQINITTKLKVLENNADKVNGNTYTWNINDDNYTNKPIYMEISISNQFSKFQSQLIIGAIILVLISLLTVLIITARGKINNKI